MYETPKENSRYRQYQELGGIINEKDYEGILAKTRNIVTSPGKEMIKQLELMAQFAGIELSNTENATDQRIVLYGILRADTKPEETKYHHSQLSDQRLFAEVLRILGDSNALNKLIGAYHKVGTHCPICLKIVASGEECR
jgi:hypothetical protein